MGEMPFRSVCRPSESSKYTRYNTLEQPNLHFSQFIFKPATASFRRTYSTHNRWSAKLSVTIEMSSKYAIHVYNILVRTVSLPAYEMCSGYCEGQRAYCRTATSQITVQKKRCTFCFPPPSELGETHSSIPFWRYTGARASCWVSTLNLARGRHLQLFWEKGPYSLRICDMCGLTSSQVPGHCCSNFPITHNSILQPLGHYASGRLEQRRRHATIFTSHWFWVSQSHMMLDQMSTARSV